MSRVKIFKLIQLISPPILFLSKSLDHPKANTVCESRADPLVYAANFRLLSPCLRFKKSRLGRKVNAGSQLILLYREITRESTREKKGKVRCIYIVLVIHRHPLQAKWYRRCNECIHEFMLDLCFCCSSRYFDDAIWIL